MGSRSHKLGFVCAANLRKKESVNSKFARGCVNKLLLEVVIDLGLNLLKKLQFSVSGFFYLKDS